MNADIPVVLFVGVPHPLAEGKDRTLNSDSGTGSSEQHLPCTIKLFKNLLARRTIRTSIFLRL